MLSVGVVSVWTCTVYCLGFPCLVGSMCVCLGQCVCVCALHMHVCTIDSKTSAKSLKIIVVLNSIYAP